jgi:hypothetical protein
MKNKESLKDKIINTFLYTKSLVSSIFGSSKKNNSDITSKMELIFEDNFQSFNKDIWRIGQPWGKFHPGSPYQYYGDESVFIQNDCLILNQIYSLCNHPNFRFVIRIFVIRLLDLNPLL